jgi:hypothetical protein
MTFGLWNVRIKSGLADSRELQLTTPQTSVERTFPRLAHQLLMFTSCNTSKLTYPRLHPLILPYRSIFHYSNAVFLVYAMVLAQLGVLLLVLVFYI